MIGAGEGREGATLGGVDGRALGLGGGVAGVLGGLGMPGVPGGGRLACFAALTYNG